MTIDEVFAAIAAEVIAAEKKFPRWPDDEVHSAAIVCEEAGELIQAALDFYYCRCLSGERMRREAIQTGAMAVRFLLAHDADDQHTLTGSAQKEEQQ